MKEHKIIINIDNEGKIFAQTEGIYGEKCVSELKKIFKDLSFLENSEFTSDYQKKEKIIETKKIYLRGKENE
jgi:hypothetical protein